MLWTLAGSAHGETIDVHGASVFHVEAGRIARGWVLEGDQYAVDSFFA